MKNQTKREKTAFSLIELSMVISIVAILAGALLIGANKIVYNTRIAAAQAMSAASPVKDMPGLTLWLDAVWEGSFTSSEINSQTAKISIWNDVMRQYSARQSTAANQPVYVTKAINGLPGVFFSSSAGVGMVIDNSLTSDNYSIFIVFNSNAGNGSRRAIQSQTANWLIGPCSGYIANYSGTTSSGGWVSQTNVAQVAGKAYLATAVRSFSSNNGVSKFYVNGVDATASSTFATPPSALALGASGYYNEPLDGNIGEVIVFNRNLKDDERQDVETYLMKKWSI